MYVWLIYTVLQILNKVLRCNNFVLFRARYEAESNVQKAELSLLEAKRTIVTLQGENTRAQDNHRNLKEDLERAQATIKSQREQIKSQRDEYSKELQELKLTVSNEKHKHDTERSDIQEQLNKVYIYVQHIILQHAFL